MNGGILFDGRSLDQWRGYKNNRVPAGWQAVDGALTRVGAAGDLITRDVFGDFELELEWTVVDGGNSGIMYRVTEEAAETYQTGPEMQVLDDARHPDGGSRLTAAGAVYGLYPAPAGVVQPAGEWNAVRIVVRGNHVEHWLNGVEVATYELASPDWIGESRWQQVPDVAGVRAGGGGPHRAPGPRRPRRLPEHQDPNTRAVGGLTQPGPCPSRRSVC